MYMHCKCSEGRIAPGHKKKKKSSGAVVLPSATDPIDGGFVYPPVLQLSNTQIQSQIKSSSGTLKYR
jgi:hypothetical protein